MIVLVMGVSGSGKSTLGASLAAELGWEFLEGDAFHPAANIAKMSRGVALDDADRAPWLASLRAEIEHRLLKGAHAVLACSALKRSYRAALMGPDAGAFVILHLAADEAALRRRLSERRHFMPASLLESQLQTLEAPEQGEGGCAVFARLRGELPPEVLVLQARAAVDSALAELRRRG